ncbi:MAG: peptidoglycan DD-metalloendopeptidase family protein [Gammaproteobacteria bacterium]|nr:peptidoglycan DD-metalloendopeptidase family protein [Gammaproteobacteria bacterium]
MLATALLLALWINTAVAADEGSQAKAKLESVLAELNDLESWLSDAERRRLRWLKDVQVRDGAVARLSAAVGTGEAALANIRGALADLQVEQQRLNAQREEAVRRLANHLAAAYRLSGEQFVKLLFNQQSAATLERVLAYHRFITTARIQALDAFRQLSLEIERNAEALQTQRAVERRDLEHLRLRRQSLRTEREARDALIAALDQEFEDKENRRTRLLADRQRLQSLIDQIERRTIPGVGGFTARKGSLAWPLRGELAARFGEPRGDGEAAWQGLLLNAPTGAAVAAVHGGRVVFADWLRGFGNMAIIDHGEGYMTLYGQADQLTKKVNDLVEAGEVVAHAGQSGGAAASGIYFELRHKGQTVDPWQWLAPP